MGHRDFKFFLIQIFGNYCENYILKYKNGKLLWNQ